MKAGMRRVGFKLAKSISCRVISWRGITCGKSYSRWHVRWTDLNKSNHLVVRERELCWWGEGSSQNKEEVGIVEDLAWGGKTEWEGE